MNSQMSSSATQHGLGLSGILQKTGLLLWGLVTLTSLISLSFSIYRLYLWDRIPAGEMLPYFPDLLPEYVQLHAEWQDAVLQTGLSLSGYALIFTLARAIGGLSLFIVGFLLVRRHSGHRMVMLMAALLSVFAAAGIWNNTLFAWGVASAPWLNYPAQLLGWLLWCGAIVIYTFPDGKFTPRWTLWLAILLLPLTFLMAFDIDTSLNPATWPGPLYLLPNVLFVGGGLVAVLSRYRRADFEQKQAMRWYVWGISLLIVVHFINLLLTDGYYWITGHALFQGTRAGLTYVFINEPIWFACETFLAVGLALAVFRDGLIDRTARSIQG